jgi:hypothetical protein
MLAAGGPAEAPYYSDFRREEVWKEGYMVIDQERPHRARKKVVQFDRIGNYTAT